MIRIFALECQTHFLAEYRTELYEQYYLGETEVKNVSGAKNDLRGQACLGLERRVA